MHNLERFGFRSDCFSLKDNLNYMSSAFPGPKPCFNHQLCCHGPWLLCLAHRSHPQESHSRGMGAKCSCSPCSSVYNSCWVPACSTWRTGILWLTDRKEGPAPFLPSHSPAAMKNCFISAAFVLLLCKNPSDCVVSDIKKAQKQRRSFPDSSQRLLCHMAVQRNSVLMGSCYKWREWNLEILLFHLYDT